MLKGVDQTLKNLLKISRVIDRPPTLRAARALAKKLGEAAPVGTTPSSRDPGELSRSFKAKGGKKIYTSAAHAFWVNNGTRRMPANPFITRTLASAGQDTLRIIQEEAARRLKKLVAEFPKQ